MTFLRERVVHTVEQVNQVTERKKSSLQSAQAPEVNCVFSQNSSTQFSVMNKVFLGDYRGSVIRGICSAKDTYVVDLSFILCLSFIVSQFFIYLFIIHVTVQLQA